jgi:hypothetical protein
MKKASPPVKALAAMFANQQAAEPSNASMNDSSKRAAPSSPVKEKLAELKKLRASADEAGSSASPAGSSNAVLEAIELLSKKMDRMALKSDLDDLRSDLHQQTTTIVSDAVDPIKVEVDSMKSRISALESGVGIQPNSKETLELQKMVNNFDPALRQIAFMGWPDSVSLQSRTELMEKFVQDHAPGSRIMDSGTFYSGPYSDRKPTKASYVEFSSNDLAKDVLNKIKGHQFKNGSSTISVKPARTKLNSKRNTSLFKALDLIKETPESANKDARIDWPERKIKVADVDAFVQKNKELGGTFLSPFVALQLP